MTERAPLPCPPELLRSYAPDPERYRADVCPAWIDEIDLAVTDAHVRMGTRALPTDHWLVRDEHAGEEVALRRRLLRDQRSHVFACSHHAEAAAEEVAELVEGWTASRPPLDLPATEESHPLARAGASVQEDFCLMVHHDDRWHLEGAVLCFPSAWILAEKLGRPTALVHGPVPYYAAELSRRVDMFFDRLSPDKPVWRRNFSLWPTLLLWAPFLTPALCRDQPFIDGVPTGWLRSERQTLRRLARSGAILFTIRVQVAPLSVLAQRPGRARQLAAWLRAPAGETRRHEMGPLADATLAWLDAVAETGH